MKKADSWYYDNAEFIFIKGHSHNKYCCCGGHNHSNPKKNLHNHSTKMRYLYRLSRKYWKKNRESA